MIDLPKFELPFFAALLLLLVLARFFGELFERMKQPAMIGEIIAGIILGPTLLNFIHRTEELKVISDLGVFLLVILAGLEINFDDILTKQEIASISKYIQTPPDVPPEHGMKEMLASWKLIVPPEQRPKQPMQQGQRQLFLAATHAIALHENQGQGKK
jgi:predicted Kef-type K+ transport protein